MLSWLPSTPECRFGTVVLACLGEEQPVRSQAASVNESKSVRDHWLIPAHHTCRGGAAGKPPIEENSGTS